MKIKFKIIFLVSIFLAITIYLIIFVRPPLPKNWDKVKVGMKKADILAAFPNINTSMREVKGFDQVNIDNEMPYYSNGYWQMLIFYYENDDRVYQVSWGYVDKNCGLFNKAIILN